MKTRYEIAGLDSTSRPVLQTDDQSLTVARVMDVEFGTEPLSRKTIDGAIRIISDANGFGKYVNIDKVFNDLLHSGFLVKMEVP